MIIGLVSAIVVVPDQNAVRNSGDSRLPQMKLEFSLDCPSKTITVTALNENKEPVANSNMYIFYTNYAYQPIATGHTNQNGVGQMNIVGNPNYLTALFVLRIGNPAYQSKEIEFTYEKCFGTVSDEQIKNPPAPPPLPQDNGNKTYGANNATTQPTPTPVVNNTPINPRPNQSVVQNITANQNATNGSQNPLDGLGCKLPIAILGFLGLGAFINNIKQ